MPQYTPDEFTSLLTRTFAAYQPRTVRDTDPKGVPVIEWMLPNPHDPRFSVSLQLRSGRAYVDTCSLWFGQIELSGHMSTDAVVSAIEEIISDRVVAILRYRNRDAYENHRPSTKKWLYQLTDDEDDESAELEDMKARLRSAPTLTERISGKLLGTFEVFSWSESEVISR